MVVTFIMQNGRRVEINDLQPGASWIDAALVLYENNIIDEHELMLFEQTKNGTRPVSSGDVYNFKTQQFSNVNAAPPGKSPLKRKSATHAETTSKPRPGLKKKSRSGIQRQSHPSSGLKKKTSTEGPIAPSPISGKTHQQSRPTPAQRKHQPMPAPPKSRRGIKHYEMDINCSVTGKNWTAKLLGLTAPSRSSPQSKPEKTSIHQRTIYLCLDDSISMRGDAISQLKSAAVSFLKDRPSSETIHVLSFNNTASYSGSPSGAVDVVGNLYPDGSTPMSSCLDKISSGTSSSKQGDDVVILFSDGEPDSRSDTTASASRVRQNAKLIAIGCGSDVDQHYMMSLASSKGDYHHASNPGQILSVFQQVARSLAQVPVVSGAKPSGNASRAQQIGVVSNINSNSGYQTSNKLATDEGFDLVEDFECPECGSTGRAVCVCGAPLCQGGMRDMGKGNLPMMTCPVCQMEFELEHVDTLHASTRGSGGKKK